MDIIVAERTLSYTDSKGLSYLVKFQVGQPYPDGKGAWCCEYQVGAPLHISGKAYGEDGIQALLLSLMGARARLTAEPGILSWFGDVELGLPNALNVSDEMLAKLKEAAQSIKISLEKNQSMPIPPTTILS